MRTIEAKRFDIVVKMHKETCTLKPPDEEHDWFLEEVLLNDARILCVWVKLKKVALP